MKIGCFDAFLIGKGKKAEKGKENIGNEHLLSQKDEVLFSPKDTLQDKEWDKFSKLEEMSKQLKQENEQLKKEVEELKEKLGKEKKTETPVQLDLKSGRFTLNNISYKGLNVEKMVFRNDRISEQINELATTNIFEKDPKEFKDDFFEILRGPFIMEDGLITFKEKTLTALLRDTDEFEKNNIHNLEARYEEGKCKVTGKYGDLIPVPFSLEYSLGFEKNKLNIHLDKIKVMGFIPVPGIIQDIMVESFGSKFDKGLIQKDKEKENTFTINVGAMLPIGLKANFQEVKAEKGTLTIHMGPPDEQEK